MVTTRVTLGGGDGRDPIDDRPNEECGVLGISTPHGDGVAQMAFFGLFALQHRGQEAAGIAVSDGRRARVHKDEGLVANVFTGDTLAPLTGYHAIGHTRYSTTGSNAVRNIQPRAPRATSDARVWSSGLPMLSPKAAPGLWI